MAKSVACRSKGTSSRAVVDVSGFLDSESTVELHAIVNGEDLRRIAGSSDKIDLCLVTDGTDAYTLRLAGQGSNMHIQLRYNGGTVQALNVPPSSFKDWRKYSVVAGVDGASGDWLKVAEELDDRTYAYAQDGGDINITSTSTSPGALSGADYIWAPTHTDDPDSNSDTEQGPFTFWLVAFRTGADVLGSSATPADMFAEPDPATCSLYYKFDNGDGSTVSSTVTGYGTDAVDLVLGGSHRTDWLSLGRNDRPDLQSLPSGAYVAEGATVTGGQVKLHHSGNNTADGDDPEFGYEDNRFNFYDDTFQVLARCSDLPTGWYGSGNPFGAFTFAPRGDLGASTNTAMVQAQVGWETAGTAQQQFFCQYRPDGGGISRQPTAPAYNSALPGDGDVILSWEGDGVGGFKIKVAFLGQTRDDWEEIMSVAAATFAVSDLDALDYRSQSKNRTGSTSAFTGTNITALERFGSENLRIFSDQVQHDTTITEGGIGGDSFTAARTMPRDLTEGGRAGDRWDVSRVISFPDLGAVGGDSFHASISNRNYPVTEGGIGGETFAVELVKPGDLTEGGLGGDTFDVVMARWVRGITEGGLGGDSFVATVTGGSGTIIPASITEGGLGGDSFVAEMARHARSITEGGLGGDDFVVSRPFMSGAIIEGGLGGDAFLGQVVRAPETITEGGLGGDSFVGQVVQGSVANMLIEGITTDVTTVVFTAAKIVYDLQPNRLTLVGVRSSETSAYLTGGTALLTVYNIDDTELAGVTWPVSMPFVAGSSGNYSGLVPATASWVADHNYRGRISLTTGSEQGVFDFDIRCKRRGTT